MTILAVDDAAARLSDLARLLRSTFPEDTVIAESDALAAGKFGFTHPVDALFAAVEMPRLDGGKLMEFIRHANPDAMAFLLLGPESTFYSVLWTEEPDGLLHVPVTEAQLIDAVRRAQAKRAANRG